MSEIKEFSFSQITFENIKSVIKIEKKYNLSIFQDWFNINEISNLDLEFLKKLNSVYGENFASVIKHFSEETLKAKFIIPILNKVDFFSPERYIADFYNESLKYQNDNFCFSGFCDFYVARGIEYPEKPLFFIQEFKKGEKYSDPEPQLIAELIAGLEIGNLQNIKGAYIIGSIWNFVYLYKNNDKYIYTISQNFDSTKLSDLIQIFSNLLFVKNEIFNSIK